jgi:tRNA-binding protein
MSNNTPLPIIPAEAFFNVEMRVGIITEAKPFPEARKPANQVWADFGEGYGILKTSAQVTQLYTPETLVGRRVVGWLNAPHKQIGPFTSQFLLLGAHDTNGHVALLNAPEVPIGARIC